MDKVIIIEDEQNMRTMLTYLMLQNHFSPESYVSAEDFLNNHKHYDHCIYLVDSKLPGIQGPDVIRSIRIKDKVSPIFIVSAANQEDDIGQGLKAGADDYVVKPFHPDHLITKVKNAHNRNSIIFEKLHNKMPKLHAESKSIQKERLIVPLTAKEYRLMEIFMNYSDKIVSRKYLMNGLYADECNGRNVDALVFGLRKKLKILSLEIETIRSAGYRFRAAPSPRG